MRENLKQRDIIAAYLSVIDKSPRQDEITAQHIGEPIWNVIRDKPKRIRKDGTGVIDVTGPPDSLVIYPIAPPGLIFFKYFKAPFPDYRNYFKVHTYGEIIEAVKKQINDGEYRTFRMRPFAEFMEKPKILRILESDDEYNLKELLRFCLTVYPGETLGIKELRDLLSKIMEQRQHPDTKTRSQAENFFSSLTRPGTKHYVDISVPSHLYINGLFDYLHQVTLALREYQQNPSREKPAAHDELTEKEKHWIAGDHEKKLTRGHLKKLTKNKVHEVFSKYASARSLESRFREEREIFKNHLKCLKNPKFSRLIFPIT